jgi:hypothetical protein
MVYFDLSCYEDPVEEVFYGEDFQKVGEEEICDKDRWRTYYSQVLRLTSDDSFWRADWSRGSTEYQDEGVEGLTLVRVAPYLVTVTKYYEVEE